MTDDAHNDTKVHAGHHVHIIVDAMGGDFAPGNEVAGVLEALERSSSIQITLVGREEELLNALGSDASHPRLRIVHADDVIAMGDEPSTIVKQRKTSSLYVGLDLVRQKSADAFVSAGNTGGVMATSTMLCGRIPGVSRPTIGTFMPTKTGRPTLLLDVGANVDSKPKFLSDYAIMGSVYTQLMNGVTSPTVGLLNVGEEPGKGTEVAQQAFELLRTNGVNFVGNVEGRDILAGTVDVVVCDGFEGNIVLKFAESILSFLKERFRAYANRGIFQKLLMAAFTPVLRSALSGMDYQEYGGVPLLGVNGVTIIGHGSSSPKALANMILRAEEVVRKDVNGIIERTLAQAATAPKELV